MVLFDELGLAERAPTNPLKVLHTKLEYDGKTEGVCFIGISNYSLDIAKVNRTLNLSIPNLEEKLDQLKATSKSIVESISEDLSKENSEQGKNKESENQTLNEKDNFAIRDNLIQDGLKKVLKIIIKSYEGEKDTEYDVGIISSGSNNRHTVIEHNIISTEVEKLKDEIKNEKMDVEK